ncbi:MAG TPA: class II glutamine amidotransferase [Stellaceae bacterium]|nr:class II glutamine amidotransferase [Stellaceae bacterium]
MCELFALSARRPTVASFSLERFAARGAEPGRNLDGWGLVFYDGRSARVYREPEPAAGSPWLQFIERRRVPSTLVLSHIRHRTRGAMSLANTQPFARELGGRVHVFAHNGRLDGIDGLAETAGERFRPIGDTDSEIAFCLLLDRLSSLWSSGVIPSLDARLAVVAPFAAELRALGPANFLYADGDCLFAHGDRRTQADGRIAPPGLWLLARRCPFDRDARPLSGVAIDSLGAAQELTLLASVPLSREAWRPLWRGQLIAVKEGGVVMSIETDPLFGAAHD